MLKQIFKAITVVAMSVSFQNAIGQQQNVIPMFQSPNASGLGTIGKTNISAFTGLPDISVNVFSLKQGDISVNCDLRYNSGGVKCASHPGWVGQNWSLSVGGVVTRKVNGSADEVLNPTVNGNVSDTNPADAINIFSYLLNYNVLNQSTWYTSSFISNYYANANSVNTTSVNPAPDEFSFTLPTGISGSFFLNDLGQWVVKSTSPVSLKIAVQTGSPIITHASGYSITLGRAIYAITITDDKGFVYTFGNSNDAIEYSRGPRNTDAYNYYTDVIANAWHLTNISSPTGNSVNFIYYPRKENQYVVNVQYPNDITASIPSNNGGAFAFTQTTPQYSGQVISPVYLQKITCNAFTANFSIGATTEQTYTQTTNGNTFSGNKFNYSDLEVQDVTTPSASFINSLSVWYQLNSIVINDNAGIAKYKYNFYYTSNSSQRLFLNEFRKVNLNPQTTIPDLSYAFVYNTINQLPAYNAMQQDQWGYYNGIQFPQTITPGQTAVSQYFNTNNVYAQAGILQKIIYPTGGNTTFNWEPNDYNYTLSKNGNSIQLASASGTGGGLRIQSVVNSDNNGHTYTTSYVYKWLGTSNSSGILSGYNKIYYAITIGSGANTTANVSGFVYEDMRNLDYTNGRDVVYSEVQEILPDGSYNVYDYSNSDVSSQYMDEIPVNIYTNAYNVNKLPNGYAGQTISAINSSNTYPFLSHSSRELERGQLLKLRSYTNSTPAILVKQVQNTYNSDATRYNSFVKSYDSYSNAAPLGNQEVVENYFQAVKIYTYYPYLQSSITTTWDKSGNNPFSVTKNYTYDNFDNKKTESFTSSKNETVTNNYNYAHDAISGLGTSASNAQTAMINANVISIPMEMIATRNSTTIAHNRSDFQTVANGSSTLIFPAAHYFSESSNALELRQQYNKFDNYGNLLEDQKATGVKNAYLWDYNSTYPIATINNASQTNVAYTSFESNGTGNWVLNGGSVNTSGGVTGTNGYNLASGNSIACSGLTTGNYIVSYWTKGNSLSVNGATAAITATINGWNLYIHKLSNISAATVTGSGTVDELRLYPSTALMTTYTYLPLAGISSMCDPASHITYYQYDGLQRLISQSDGNTNIVKSLAYNVVFSGTFYNTEQDFIYQKNNCGAGYSGSNVTYVVPAGMFSATSQADANAQAQAYAYQNQRGQNYANSNGVCNVGVSCNNSLSQAFTLTFTNTSTSTNYVCNVSANITSQILNYLPPGSYNVSCVPVGTYNLQYAFQVGTNAKTGTHTLNFTGISVSVNSDAVVYISSPGGQN